MKSLSKGLVRASAFAYIIFIFGSWVIVAQSEVTGEKIVQKKIGVWIK